MFYIYYLKIDYLVESSLVYNALNWNRIIKYTDYSQVYKNQKMENSANQRKGIIFSILEFILGIIRFRYKRIIPIWYFGIRNIRLKRSWLWNF